MDVYIRDMSRGSCNTFGKKKKFTKLKLMIDLRSSERSERDIRQGSKTFITPIKKFFSYVVILG